MAVQLIVSTPYAERNIAHMARVSSKNQDNPEIAGLIRYMINHKHWSPFEMASMTVEIETSRMIAQQILRHKSFSFQEFSQRYADIDEHIPTVARLQAVKNRQSSLEIDPENDGYVLLHWWASAQDQVWELSHKLYKEAIDLGIAREVARSILPLSTKTKMYMSGTIRSWLHFIELRTGEDTQLEHRMIALECKKIFIDQFPLISEAMGWE